MSEGREGKRTDQPCRSVRQSKLNQPEDGQPGQDWVPIELPPKIEQTLSHWAEYDGPKVGWCLLCDQPILRGEDFIPDTDLHSCPEGQRFHREHNKS
jgi:hypothetical protein